MRARQRGFSFLWTLVLVAMLAVGLSAATEAYQTSLNREQERELLAIGRQFRQVLAGYYETQLVAGKREYPAALEDLLRDRRFPGMKRHLRKIFVDPATGKTEWGLVRVGGRIVGIHSLSDRPPTKRENFDQDDIAFQGKPCSQPRRHGSCLDPTYPGYWSWSMSNHCIPVLATCGFGV